jgi:hypothetical protein
MVALVASPERVVFGWSIQDRQPNRWRQYVRPRREVDWTNRGPETLRQVPGKRSPMIGARSAAAILEHLSRRRAFEATSSEVARFLQDLLGQQIAAVVAGISQPQLIGHWAHAQGVPPDAAERRLRAAFQAAWLIAQAESTGAARAWFLGKSPYLGNRSPALVIADDEEQGSDRALGAARAYLAHG